MGEEEAKNTQESQRGTIPAEGSNPRSSGVSVQRKRKLGETFDEASSGNLPEIDEDLQRAVYGNRRETTRKLSASNVLISGLQGLGAEIAKNLVLVGTKSITLHDDKIVELSDLSSNVFLKMGDIGMNRAAAIVSKLRKLNDSVIVSSITELSLESLSDFQVVVLTDTSLGKAMEFNDYCHYHQPPIAFIKSEIRGLFGSVFCDFGHEFVIDDIDGEESCTRKIASISNHNPAVVSCVRDEILNFDDGDFVVFSEICGMIELNDGRQRKVKHPMPYSFTLEEDTTLFGGYDKGGLVTKVKLPKVLNFRTLKDALKDPGDYPVINEYKADRQPLLHLAFQALDMFRQEFGRFPSPTSKVDAEKLVFHAGVINESMENSKHVEIDEHILQIFASGSGTTLSPMAAIFGGLVGEEVAKACSGKFHPLYQFLYLDSIESLPTEGLDPADSEPVHDRYDSQIAVFGSQFQKKLGEANVFVVGCNTLGCEFLKNLALMGVGCSSKGKVVITDADLFLKSKGQKSVFGDWNVWEARSTMASAALASINPDLRIETHQYPVCQETEHVFEDAFWRRLGAVVSVLDDADARMYLDTRCILFKKRHLVLGTSGTKFVTLTIIPEVTEIYAVTQNPLAISGAEDMVTSSAMAAGLACLELYKVLDKEGSHKREDYRNTSVDLALPLFSMTDPAPPMAIQHRGSWWTLWDGWELNIDGLSEWTIWETIQWLRDGAGFHAHRIYLGKDVLYDAAWGADDARALRVLRKKVVEVAEEAAGQPLVGLHIHLAVACVSDEDDNHQVHIRPLSILLRTPSSSSSS